MKSFIGKTPSQKLAGKIDFFELFYVEVWICYGWFVYLGMGNNDLPCKKCGSEMKKGVAIMNEKISHNGRVWSYSGDPKRVKVMKCVKCGYSHT